MVAGAYIRLKNGNIELHAPGKIDFKAGSYPHGGPTSMAQEMPTMAKSDGDFNRQVVVVDDLRQQMPNRRVKVLFGDGRVEQQITDSEGKLKLYANDVMDLLKIEPYEETK